MNLIKSWNHRWFGLWKEMGLKYADYPSIEDFITDAHLEKKEQDLVVAYINSGVPIATTSRLAFPCVFTGKVFPGTMSSRTDGEWLWYDHIAYYIEEYGLSIPIGMLENIGKNNYVVPAVSQEQIELLERPIIR